MQRRSVAPLRRDAGGQRACRARDLNTACAAAYRLSGSRDKSLSWPTVDAFAHIDVAQSQVDLHAWRKQRHDLASSAVGVAGAGGDSTGLCYGAGVCGVLSLRHFRLASWCSLSLGGWWPSNPARRISTCRLTRTRRLVGAAAAAGRTMVMSPAAPDSFVVIFRVGADAAAANELRGRRRRQPGSKAALTVPGNARCSASGRSIGHPYPRRSSARYVGRAAAQG